MVDRRSRHVGVLDAAEQLVEEVVTAEVRLDVVRRAKEFQLTDAGKVLVVVRLLNIQLVCLTANNRTLSKGKGFPYSIPSVGPGADPGVQAVSLQVTVKSSARR